MLEENFFVEKVFPLGVTRGLSDEEMAAYRLFAEAGEGRRWPSPPPIDDERANITELVNTSSAWLRKTRCSHIVYQ